MSHWPLFVLLLVAGSLRAFFFTGLLGSDDTAYAQNAIAILRGTFHPAADMTTMRIVLDGGAAASFALLGLSEWSMGVPAFLSALLTLTAVYAIALLEGGTRAAIIAGMLYAVSPLNILNSSVLLPEVPMGLCVALAVLLILRARRAPDVSQAIPLAAASGLLIGLGYLVKEPAALMVSVFGITGLVAVVSGDRRGWLYAAAIGGFGLIFVAETIFHLLVAGELLHRFRGIAQHQATAVLESAQERQLQSVWLYPRSMFVIVNQAGFLFYLLVGTAAFAVARRWRTPLVVALWLVILFLYLEFGSTSLTSYNALPKQPRYLEALTAPAVILLGCWLEPLLRSPGRVGRGVAYGALAVYVVTSPIFTAISFFDREATTRPIRAAAAFLAAEQLRPIAATSLIANGLSVWALYAGAPDVARACAGCRVGPCTGGSAEPTMRGEVWAVPVGVQGGVAAPVARCAWWRRRADVSVSLPDYGTQVVRSVLWVMDRFPMPAVARRELRPVRDMLLTGFVRIHIPSEATDAAK